MKLFLDDIRSPPSEGWMVFRDVPSFIHFARYCKQGDILSFDHDLGEESKFTGYDAIKQLEKEVYTEGLWSVSGVPEFRIHSANPTGRDNILAAINSIRKELKILPLTMLDVYMPVEPPVSQETRVVKCSDTEVPFLGI